MKITNYESFMQPVIKTSDIGCHLFDCFRNLSCLSIIKSINLRLFSHRCSRVFNILGIKSAACVSYDTCALSRHSLPDSYSCWCTLKEQVTTCRQRCFYCCNQSSGWCQGHRRDSSRARRHRALGWRAAGWISGSSFLSAKGHRFNLTSGLLRWAAERPRAGDVAERWRRAAETVCLV